VIKQGYIHYSLDVIICLPLHVHNCDENVLKHVLFYVHDIKVMTEEIGLAIKKFLENLCFIQLWVKPKPENFCLPD
jgi:hypothetical protein